MRFILKVTFIVLIFIIGYFVGVFGANNILRKLLLEMSEVNLLEIIGISSSIITLFLFITYIIGRIILIKKMEVTLNETIELSYGIGNQNFIVTEEYNLGEINSEIVYLTSSQPLRWIKIYKYNFNDEDNPKGHLVHAHNVLTNGHALKINTYLPEGIPNYLVEYQRFDYIVGVLVLAENGKNGNLGENLMIKHTFKSVFYYLVNK